MPKSAYQIQQEFFKEYSLQAPFKNIIYKIRRFENVFYEELKEISNLSYPTQEKVLDRTFKEYSLKLLHLRLKALMKCHTDFGHEVYQMIANEFEFICSITENVMKAKINELKRENTTYYMEIDNMDVYITYKVLKNVSKYGKL